MICQYHHTKVSAPPLLRNGYSIHLADAQRDVASDSRPFLALPAIWEYDLMLGTM